MDEVESAVLRAAEQIIDDEYHTHEATRSIMEMFGLGPRQAALALRQIRNNFTYTARKAGMELDDYAASLSMERKMAVFGFCVGAVCQRDMDLGLNPLDGERRRPDYEI